jgi:hypothetical protein
MELTLGDASVTLDFPAGSEGVLDCAGVCWPPAYIYDFYGSSFPDEIDEMYSEAVITGGACGNGSCDDGNADPTAPAGTLAPDLNCEAWSFDAGDCS